MHNCLSTFVIDRGYKYVEKELVVSRVSSTSIGFLFFFSVAGSLGFIWGFFLQKVFRVFIIFWVFCGFEGLFLGFWVISMGFYREAFLGFCFWKILWVFSGFWMRFQWACVMGRREWCKENEEEMREWKKRISENVFPLFCEVLLWLYGKWKWLLNIRCYWKHEWDL